jgi:succinylarginine dihydrolase
MFARDQDGQSRRPAGGRPRAFGVKRAVSGGDDVGLREVVALAEKLLASCTSGSAAWTSSRTCRQIACCHLGSASM